jgi:hypothetical protein
MVTEDQIPPPLPLLAAHTPRKRWRSVRKGGITPLWQRGEGRFSETYVFFSINSFVT